MGLDKQNGKENTGCMTPLAKGLGTILRALGLGKKARLSPFEHERRSYRAQVRKELVELKKKGISIPVFTL